MRYPFFPVLLILFLAGCSTQVVKDSSEGTLAQGADASVIERLKAEERRVQESDVIYQILIGELAGKEGNLGLATAAYQGAALSVDDPRVAERATRVALFSGQDQAALEMAQHWLRLEPESLEAWKILAVLHARRSELAPSVEYFEKIIAATRDQKGGGFRLAGALLIQDVKRDQAMPVMSELSARHPEDYEAAFTLSSVAFSFKQYEDAIAAAEQGLALNPDSDEMRLLRNRVWLLMGETDRALNDIEAMVKAGPENVDIRLTYAQMLVEVRRYDAAREQFEIIVARQPDNVDLLYTLGLLNVEIQDFDDAERYLLTVLQMGKHTQEASYYLGRISERRGSNKEAIGWYLRVTEGEFLYEAQTRIAIQLANLGYLDKAQTNLSQLRLAVSTAEERVRLYLLEASLLEEAGRKQEAYQLYTNALKDYPDNEDLLYARGMLSERLDRVDLLEQDMKQILKRSPNHAAALNALGYTLADRTERFEEALKYIQEALRVNPDDPAILDSMGWVQYRLGNLDEAERYLRRAHAMLSDDEIASHLGEILWVRGNRDEANAIIQDALKQFPDSQYLKKLIRRIDQ
jgi:tetratricopeptide (TPR) repeat protein